MGPGESFIREAGIVSDQLGPNGSPGRKWRPCSGPGPDSKPREQCRPGLVWMADSPHVQLRTRRMALLTLAALATVTLLFGA